MKTMILYRSKHHGNTKKLVDAVVNAFPEVEAIDVATLGKNEYPDLSEYPLVGVGTGIYYGEIDKDLARVLANTLCEGQQVFALMTYGGKDKWYGKDIDGLCRMRKANFLTSYGCLGYDTWGPYKLMGGMWKDHPNDEDIQGAIDHYQRLMDEYGDIIVDQYEQARKRAAWAAAHPAGGLMANIKRSAKKIANKSAQKKHDRAPEHEAASASDRAESADFPEANE